jgi:hypothetical protein
MGLSSSKSSLIDENVDKSYVIDENMMKSFLSEYCEISPSNFVDLNSFFFAFLAHAKFKYDVHLQRFLSHIEIKIKLLYYLDKHGRCLIYGYPASKIIVGVKLKSWPLFDNIESKKDS